MSMLQMGQVVMTRGVNDLIAESTQAAKDVMKALRSHARGHWGDVCAEDKKANDDAVKHGDRILSAYQADGHKIWIITEWDRSVTTILFPDEY